jgi:hypothetical protein
MHMSEIIANVAAETVMARELNGQKILGQQTRTYAQAIAVAAVLALWFAPGAAAQSGSQGNAAATAQNSSAAQSGGSATGDPASSSNVPKMEDQSAPAADSLGEAARKARAQKAKAADGAAAPKKVYTDDSVSSLSGHGVSFVGGSGSSGDSNTSGSGASGGSAAPPAQGQSQEAYWRGRAQAIRNQMAQIDQQISRVQDDIAKNGAVSVDPSSGAQQGVIIVEDRNMEIKRLEDQKAGLQTNLDDLAEEGRKAGADSGWFR